MKTRQDGPDFLCIGMQKSATAWLYDALNELPEFRMPPIKEFNHFTTGWRQNGTRLQRYDARLMRQSEDHRESKLGPQDLKRFRAARDRYLESGYSDETYLGMFRAIHDGYRGDITPTYSSLTRDTAGRIRDVVGDIPVILLVRDPVSRAWSHFNHRMRKHQRPPEDGPRKNKTQRLAGMAEESSADNLRKFLGNRDVVDLSFPSRMVENWSVFGDNLHIFDFREVVQSPAGVLARIATHVTGVPVSVPDHLNVSNRKSRKNKVKATPEQKDILRGHFREEIALFTERFPEIGRNWGDG